MRKGRFDSPSCLASLCTCQTQDIMPVWQVTGAPKMMGEQLFCCAFALSMGLTIMAVPAFADGAIIGLMSVEDSRVLAEFDARREAAVSMASSAGDTANVATLRQVLAGQVLPFDDGYDPSGDWRCRFLKLGGDPALAVYGWFSCRIADDGAGWVIQKTDGSQRTMGRLYRLAADRLLYLGALHYAREAPIRFGEEPTRNQMAVLTRLNDGRMRLEFPAPLVESRFDILEFTR